jgi:hypothetical protein
MGTRTSGSIRIIRNPSPASTTISARDIAPGRRDGYLRGLSQDEWLELSNAALVAEISQLFPKVDGGKSNSLAAALSEYFDGRTPADKLTRLRNLSVGIDNVTGSIETTPIWSSTSIASDVKFVEQLAKKYEDNPHVSITRPGEDILSINLRIGKYTIGVAAQRTGDGKRMYLLRVAPTNEDGTLSGENVWLRRAETENSIYYVAPLFKNNRKLRNFVKALFWLSMEDQPTLEKVFDIIAAREGN